uniref:RNA-directed RNA polymerase C-terminal domain-containing protein n=1 Tax=Riboviria sp. TaxID=2585031 RepID=A0A8K1WNV7_9VIRU|nr:MAG: hypothetical protein 1 [Riboviria sp.]
MRPNVPVEFPHDPAVSDVLRDASQGYGWPNFGHNAEMKSLVYHARQRVGLRTDAPTEGDKKLILSELERQYSAARWSIPDDFFSYEHFRRVVDGVDMQSSPGYPYLRKAPSNGVFFQQKPDGSIPEERLREIWELVQLRIRERDCDPIRLFIKPEPHKEKKLKNHRYRLISSVSIMDQLIDAMLFAPMNDKIIEECVRVPCKGGWSPFCGGWKMVPRSGVMSLDKSGWDWSAQFWLFEMDLQLRLRLCKNVRADWVDLAAWRYKCLFGNPTFVTTGGALLKQLQPGVMKSGCFNTLTTNSILQSIVHLRVCLEMDILPGWLWTLGDDTLQESIDENRQEYLDRVAQYCHVKHCVDGAEFAGMRFLGSRVEPLYRGKHSYQLLHMKQQVATEMSDSYRLLYHRSSAKNALHAMLAKISGRMSDDDRDGVWDLW